jgi:hypothetical protein
MPRRSGVRVQGGLVPGVPANGKSDAGVAGCAAASKSMSHVLSRLNVSLNRVAMLPPCSMMASESSRHSGLLGTIPRSRQISARTAPTGRPGFERGGAKQAAGDAREDFPDVDGAEVPRDVGEVGGGGALLQRGGELPAVVHQRAQEAEEARGAGGLGRGWYGGWAARRSWPMYPGVIVVIGRAVADDPGFAVVTLDDHFPMQCGGRGFPSTLPQSDPAAAPPPAIPSTPGKPAH